MIPSQKKKKKKGKLDLFIFYSLCKACISVLLEEEFYSHAVPSTKFIYFMKLFILKVFP